MRHLMNRGFVVTILTALLLTVAPAFASWHPGDPYKMHYPQLPDPLGWDVNMVSPTVLADDWLCTETGPVSDIHFWFSVECDNPLVLDAFQNGGLVRATIYSNVPPGTVLPYSHPGEPLWSSTFVVGQNASVHPWQAGGIAPQGWLDPAAGIVRPNDHYGIYQVNIVDIFDPFFQRRGTIYWLGLSVTLGDTGQPGLGGIGWKTSLEQFEDDAVWTTLMPPLMWNELRDPFTGKSLDLAFVITPEPSGLGALGAGALMVLSRRRR